MQSTDNTRATPLEEKISNPYGLLRSQDRLGRRIYYPSADVAAVVTAEES